MNIKVAAFTLSEKSINILYIHTLSSEYEQRASLQNPICATHSQITRLILIARIWPLKPLSRSVLRMSLQIKQD